ncbi:MAG: hypothetical protein ACI8ZM_005085 [Crocinitomix sp.]|jgi:hypothetical protein
MDDKISLTYQPSGKIGRSAFFWGVILIIIVLPILAHIYAYLSWYTPLLVLNILVIIGFSYAIGIAVSIVIVKLGKVRNPKFVILITFLVALIALYYAWAVWINLYMNAAESYHLGRLSFTKTIAPNKDVYRLITQPSNLFAMLQEINETGAWSISTKQNHEGTGAVKGGFATLIWVIEVILIMAFSFIKIKGKASLPFSEEFDVWLPALKSGKLIYIDDLAMLETNQNELQEIFLLQKNKVISYSQVIIYGLPGSEKYLTLINHQSFRDSKIKLSFKKGTPENQVLISEELFNKIEFQIKRLR